MDRSSLARHLLSKVQLQQQLEREMLPTGIEEFDCVTGGLPRGAITELYGPESSGKTSLLHSFLANATIAGEFCALVDAQDSFDPATAAKAGAEFERLLWVRCEGIEQAIRSADLLIHSGGWGLIVLDLSDIQTDLVRKLPISYWYRFKRAIENTPTVFIVIEREPYVKNCATMALEMQPARPDWSGKHKDFRILHKLDAQITPKKPIKPHVRLHLHSQAG